MPFSKDRAKEILEEYDGLVKLHPDWTESEIASSITRLNGLYGIAPRVLRKAKQIAMERDTSIEAVRAITDHVIDLMPRDALPLNAVESGGLTLALADLHLCDVDCLFDSFIATIKSACIEINKINTKKLTIIDAGDFISGTNIFPGQLIRNVINAPHWQALVGGLIRKKICDIIEDETGLGVDWYSVKGNHDIARRSSADLGWWTNTEALRFGVNSHYSQHDLIINLGTKERPYNALVIHGSGSSDYSQRSPKFLRNLERRVADLNAGREPLRQIKKVISGHTHWMGIGFKTTQRGTEFDNPGGWQRNTRNELGLTSRPTGMILYHAQEDALRVQQILPPEDVLYKETENQHLEFENAKKVADWLIEALEWIENNE